ncbi:TraR/DksA C4-type zinc finger protein [Desulfoluna spongiiphila]|uniref:TraR/DksA C4-type zinc finger protein n=1 Tax=Desulfoluna spongiiphila TaxID=419481 RepID=UPI001D01F6DF|nr:TraR/DksA C4-type zinc finger protein [Desulfoluna spongiiphila]
MDHAQRLEERERNAGIAEARARLSSGGESATYCAYCEEPIPEGRRKAMPGCTLCRDCQEELETM